MPRRYKPVDLTRWTADDQARFAAKVDPDGPGGCHLWMAHLDVGGYGHFHWQGGEWKAHRLAHAIAAGWIDPKLTLDHLCRIRRCVNPAHLEPVTMRENAHRGKGWDGGACKRGHDLSTSVGSYVNGRPRCLICHRAAVYEQTTLIRAARTKLGLSHSAYGAKYGWSRETARAILSGA